MSDELYQKAGPGDFRDLVAKVAAAYFSNTTVTPTDIPTVIATVGASLAGVNDPPARRPQMAGAARATPAEIRRSVTPEALVSFEDGRRYKTLKRHLTARGLTPEQYRDKWGLPDDYPMVAPNYSEARSGLAKRQRLGEQGLNARRRYAEMGLQGRA